MKTVFIVTHQNVIEGVFATYEEHQKAVNTLAAAYKLNRIAQRKEGGLYYSRWMDSKGNTAMTVAEHGVQGGEALTEQDRAEIKSMTNGELAAFWNVSQFQRRLGSTHKAEFEISLELTRRGIAHEVGRRTIPA